jgi:hypothetical protein
MGVWIPACAGMTTFYWFVFHDRLNRAPTKHEKNGFAVSYQLSAMSYELFSN